MKAKTIFINDNDEIIINEGCFHTDNYDNYMNEYYSLFKSSESTPILLTGFDHVVIDLSETCMLAVIYLPKFMSDFQKEYFKSRYDRLKQFTLYLYGRSIEEAILVDDLIDIINSKPNKNKKKKLSN